jgi:hypothetical protein
VTVFIFTDSNGVQKRVKASELLSIQCKDDSGIFWSNYSVASGMSPMFTIEEAADPKEVSSQLKRPTLTECLNALKELVG